LFGVPRTREIRQRLATAAFGNVERVNVLMTAEVNAAAAKPGI
jgi:hypothetical protein